MTILMMNGVVAYYPGDIIVENNTMSTENLVYTIINNESEIPNLYVEINKENITIEFPQDMAPNSFDIVFIENQTKEVVKIIRSGGSSRTKYVDRNVNVTETIYVPEYVDKEIIKEIEVEKIKENIFRIYNGYSLWQVLWCMVGVIALCWIITYKKKEKTAEEIVEEIQ